MQLNNNFTLRDIAGEKVIVQQGKMGINMTKIISFNESAEFLWNFFNGKEFSEEDVVKALIEEYGIDEQLAAKDATSWCKTLLELRLI